MAFACVRGQDDELQTNLESYRSLAAQIATSLVKTSDLHQPAKVQLIVLPQERAWYVEGAITEGLKDAGVMAGGDSMTTYVVEVGMSRAQVVYSNIRRDGFFGSKIVDRTVELALTTKIAGRGTGAIVESGEVVRNVRDTIGVSDIPRIENRLIPITVGVVPTEGFFSNVAEPLILLGSIAVAVFLLFNVRS
jgi:hypothetical protein